MRECQSPFKNKYKVYPERLRVEMRECQSPFKNKYKVNIPNDCAEKRTLRAIPYSYLRVMPSVAYITYIELSFVRFLIIK